jgi:small multidrug resistance pump
MPNTPWVLLTVAIVAEVIATSSLKLSDGFTRLWPSVVVVFGYGISFYFLSVTMRSMPIGVIYAIWSGLGVVLVTLVGWLVFKQHLDLPALLGIGLIIAGVIIMNVWSKSTLLTH